MATQEEILAKANEVTTSVVANSAGVPSRGGLLYPEQSNRFLDFVVDQSVLMKNARVIRMKTPQMDIDKVSVGTRLLQKATEITDDGVNAAVTFSKVSLSTVKLRLDWNISTESLEDNIEGASLEDHIAQVMARQTANDLDDLFINGNTSSGNGLLKALDGFVKLAKANGRVVDEAVDTRSPRHGRVELERRETGEHERSRGLLLRRVDVDRSTDALDANDRHYATTPPSVKNGFSNVAPESAVVSVRTTA